MGSLCTTQPIVLPDSSKVVQGTQIPEWVSAAGKQIFEQASELAKSEPTTFPGPRIAEYGDALDSEGNRIQIGTTESGDPIFQQERLTESERAGADLLAQGTDTFQPFLDKASTIADTLGKGLGDQPDFSADTVNQYMDTFQTSVDPALEQLERERELRQSQNRADAIRAGAFGGSRLGVREAMTDAEISRAGADLRRQAGRDALQFASQRFDADRDARRADFETDEASRIRAMQAQADLAPLAQGLTEQAASGLITAGQAQRALDQAALDLGYADFVEQRERPFQLLNFALGALQGVPYDTRTISLEQGQNFMAQPSIYGQTIGGLGSLASLYALSRRT